MSDPKNLPEADRLGEDNEQLFKKRHPVPPPAHGAQRGTPAGDVPAGASGPAYAKRRANAETPRTGATPPASAAQGSAAPAGNGKPAYATRRTGNATGTSTTQAAAPAPTMKVTPPVAPTGAAAKQPTPKTAAQPHTPAVRRPAAPATTVPRAVAPQNAGAGSAAGLRGTDASPHKTAAPESTAARKSAAVVKPPKEKEKKKAGTYHLGREMMSSSIKALTYIVLVLVVSVFISVFVILVGNDVFAFVKSDDEIDVTIPEGATTADIAEILAENNIISHPGIFKMYAAFKKEDDNYIAGTYTVSPSMSYDELRREFKPKPAVGTSWITIPEGYTTDEIIDLMVSYGIGTREGYVDVINNYDFDYWFIDALEAEEDSGERYYRLDGYLFPDTYEFYNSSSEATVIDRMLQRFDQVFVEDYRTRAKEIGMSVDDVLTMASLIEKEAGGAEDYRIVSSVFHNRLNRPWDFPRLESDATVVYAIQMMTGERPTTITPEDNQNTDNPYNTYLYEGLPPGPITNPSASAIRYALYPMESTYYYFISADNGTTLYASNWPQHQQNIEKVRQMNAEYAASTGD